MTRVHEPCHPWTLHSLIRFCNCCTVESAFRFSEMMLENLPPIYFTELYLSHMAVRYLTIEANPIP